MKARKINRVCVCVCISLGRITYCILHCATLTRTLSSVFPPRRSLSFPFGPKGDGVHSPTAFKLCQWTVTHWKRRQFTTPNPQRPQIAFTSARIGCPLKFLPYNFLHTCVFHIQSNSQTVGNYSVNWSLSAFKLINCMVPWLSIVFNPRI